MSLIWSPPIEISPQEAWILKRCKKARLYIFLREHRHELFDDAFQAELAGMYKARSSGRVPVPPALLAMVTLLQAALGVSDEDAVEFAVMDRRWQMLLDTLGEDDAPFSQGTLFHFRERLIEQDLDRRLLDKTVELARKTRGFSDKALRAALDASPLFGAGRVEDTLNLIGHSARELLRTVAERLQISVEAAAERAGIPLVTGSSLKANLDIDWDDPKAKKQALATLLEQVRSLQAFVENELRSEIDEPPLKARWATLKQVLAQDLEPDPEGGGARIKQGVAKDRRISVRDKDMRHGRKSRSSRVDGYKRHLAVDVETSLILGVDVRPANRPEAEATGTLLEDVHFHSETLTDLHTDRGYLSADEIAAERAAGVQVHCKPFPLQNKGRYTKADFKIDVAEQRITCPAGTTVAFALGGTTHFPKAVCQACPQRAACTDAKIAGRSVSIHEQEPFLAELRRTQRTKEGRANLRRRVPVEHRLAAIARTQGRRARFLGLRKNLFDLRRHAAVANLQVASRAA